MRKGKGVKIILAASLVCMGSISYIPTTYAATADQLAVTTNSVGQNPNTLSGLEIEGVPLDQTFSPNQKEYSVTVENEIQEITLVVESENPQASITVNGKPLNGGLFLLQTGTNLFDITVKDGSHPENTYTLTVTRKKNNNNLLKNIKLSQGELSPDFSPSKLDYNVKVGNDVKTLTITPETLKESSSILINNKPFKGDENTLSLPVRKTTITILVTAENGDKKTYSLHVTREFQEANKPPVSAAGTVQDTNNSKANGSNKGANQIQKTIPNKVVTPVSTSMPNQNSRSTNQTQTTVQKINKATLSSLTVSEGTWNKDFTADEYTYHLSVKSDAESVIIKPTAKYSSSTIKIEDGSSKTIKLDGKKTIISVIVTNGEDRKTYVMVFKKKVEKSESSPATDSPAESTVSSATNTPVTTSNNNLTIGQTSTEKGQGNTQSVSVWGRLTEGISQFFSKLF
ncbi:cadherin-like beta sandwich domain-containing protein [Neobacillus cucumis]|uniref:cadherin-like beta sandwich domain-containing protein n=1 Tax=Neobacillus cucumis TaxID=1740721 RepID=UPI0018DF0D90|nr:cadherin-like beta sandwich domain-containing protein [Neobacillus cucumis]MBI0580466.1 cadherin-like beta sandwich domain-containing protein [Neobacillus cucumis]